MQSLYFLLHFSTNEAASQAISWKFTPFSLSVHLIHTSFTINTFRSHNVCYCVLHDNSCALSECSTKEPSMDSVLHNAGVDLNMSGHICHGRHFQTLKRMTLHQRHPFSQSPLHHSDISLTRLISS